MKLHRLAACFALALAAPLSADVLVVDAALGAGADYASIRAAVANASVRSLVIVRGGSYRPFTVDGRAVTIVAEDGAAVSIDGTVRVRNTLPGQDVVLRGLSTGALDGPGLAVSDCQGLVWVEGCDFRGEHAPFVPLLTMDSDPGALVTDSAQVVLVDTKVTGGTGFDGAPPNNGGHGMIATESSVFAYDSEFRGGRGGDEPFGDDWFGGTGADGARVVGDGYLFASGSSFRGGNGGEGGFDFDIFVGDICLEGGDGGNGITFWPDFFQVGAPEPDGLVLDCQTDGGSGGPGDPECPLPGQPGTGIEFDNVALDLPAGTARRLVSERLVVEGATVRASYRGVAGETVAILGSARPRALLDELLLGVVLVGDPATILGAGVTDGTGLFELDFAAPSVTGTFGHRRLFLQAITLLEADDVGYSSATALAVLPAGGLPVVEALDAGNPPQPGGGR